MKSFCRSLGQIEPGPDVKRFKIVPAMAGILGKVKFFNEKSYQKVLQGDEKGFCGGRNA
jgi:hypothetical protein